MEENKSDKGTDEVQLIDLVAAVIRQRRVVYWLSATGFLAALVVLVVMPLFGVDLTGGRSFKVEAKATVVAVPSTVQTYFGQLPFDVFAERIKDHDAQQRTYLETLATQKERDLVLSRQNLAVMSFLEKSLVLAEAPGRSTILMTLTVREEAIEKAQAFLSSLFSRAWKESRDSIVPVIETRILALDKALDTKTSLVASADYTNLLIQSGVLKALLAPPEFPFASAVSVRTTAIPPKMGTSVLFLLVLLLSFFLGLIMALAVDGIASLRKSEKASAAIKDAWIQGKRKKP